MIERWSTGGPWEATFGYARAVAAGDFAVTAGCTSTVDGEVTHVGDPAGQARQAFEIALEALAKAGVPKESVVRTRMYVVDRAHTEAVGRVHAEIFGLVLPAATMVLVAGLLDPDHLVEVEVEGYRR
jgi:enamine deaminase RidA (YjgF/YER057c/UK114 family)